MSAVISRANYLNALKEAAEFAEDKNADLFMDSKKAKLDIAYHDLLRELSEYAKKADEIESHESAERLCYE